MEQCEEGGRELNKSPKREKKRSNQQKNEYTGIRTYIKSAILEKIEILYKHTHTLLYIHCKHFILVSLLFLNYLIFILVMYYIKNRYCYFE